MLGILREPVWPFSFPFHASADELTAVAAGLELRFRMTNHLVGLAAKREWRRI
jgi:hypothetical protein